MKKLKIAIVGAKGYAGEELIKILLKHSGVEITSLSGRMNGKPKHISKMYPYLKGKLDVFCEDIDEQKIADSADVVFTALPHSVSMNIVSKFILLGKKVIDLSADFRLTDPMVYEKWYGVKHTNPKLLSEVVYGLPEINRVKIKNVNLIANPGCYPTSVILGCAPAMTEKIVDVKNIIIDSKSGYSGGGKKFVRNYKESNCYAYQVGIHRHIPEIEQELSAVSSQRLAVSFTPHIIPQERGILSTIYLQLKKEISAVDVVAIYKRYYESEPFVRIVEIAQTKNVINTNYCDIAIDVDSRTNNIIVTSTIDNLIKGAAGQAVQNMNILFGIDETCGLL